jgi:hypothetical protein
MRFWFASFLIDYKGGNKKKEEKRGNKPNKPTKLSKCITYMQIIYLRRARKIEATYKLNNYLFDKNRVSRVCLD